MNEHRTEPIILVGSLAAPLPVEGCGCVRCRQALHHPTSSVEQGLHLPGGIIVDGPEDPTVSPGQTHLSSRRDGPGLWLAPGERHEPAGFRIVALPAATPDSSVLVIVDRERTLLWAPRPDPLPSHTVDALTDAAVDVAVLGTRIDLPTGTDRFGVATAHQIARLRSVRALTSSARILLTGLTHDSALATRPRPDDVTVMLRRWGADTAEDGATIAATGEHEDDHPRDVPRRSLVLGAASSGKSRIAEALLAAEPMVQYAATGPSPDGDDLEWTARVEAHRRCRPAWWSTWEGHDLVGLLGEPGPCVLLDSLGSWLTGVLDHCGAWERADGWRPRLDEEVDALVKAWRNTPRQVVAVAEETGAGVVPPTPGGRLFRDELGQLTRCLAAESEELLVVAAGHVVHRLVQGQACP